MPYSTREEWLIAAGERIRARVESLAKRTYPGVSVSVGFARGARGKGRAVGQCWKREVVANKQNAIFVCPTQADAVTVLAILLHEHCHAAVDPVSGHRGDFKGCAALVGLTKPFTQSIPSPELETWLKELANDLGPYPHAALALPVKGSKGSRLRLWKCACEPDKEAGVSNKVRCASDKLDAHCNRCGTDFVLDAGGDE